jgi:hypothetical protein
VGSADRKYAFVVPVPSWKENGIWAPLGVLCPHSERQLHPRVHPEIIRLLADKETDGFYKQFITFDEEDALTRAAGDDNSFFDKCDEREFAELLIARSCPRLDGRGGFRYSAALTIRLATSFGKDSIAT